MNEATLRALFNERLNAVNVTGDDRVMEVRELKKFGIKNIGTASFSN